MADVLQWDYRTQFPAGQFDVMFACPPCQGVSQARPTKPHDVEGARVLVERTLEIVRYFRPRLWFLENPRGGKLRTLGCLQDIPFVDVDYCQFSTWGYRKPTRVWGGEHINALQNRFCDPKICPNVSEATTGKHFNSLGGNNMRTTRFQKYRIPEDLVRYLGGFPNPELVQDIVRVLRVMRPRANEGVQFQLPGGGRV